MAVLTVPVPEKLSDYLEALQYDCDALRDLLVMAAKAGIENTAAYQYWTQTYLDKSREYALARGEIESAYVQPNSKGRADWRLDFKTHQLSIEEDADGQT